MSNEATRFGKGKSGNPSGRPKGLERRVRELLGDDIDAMTRVMRDIVLGQRVKRNADTGQPKLDADGKPIVEPMTELDGGLIKTRDRIEAFKVLADRGWGKARQTVDVSGDLSVNERLDLSNATEEQLRAFAMLDDLIGNDTQH